MLRNLIKRRLHTASFRRFPMRADVSFYIAGSDFKTQVTAVEGETLLQVCKDNDIVEIEGFCGGTLACSTCHVYLPKRVFTPPHEDELDLLDEAPEVTETSRLGCQVQVRKEFEGLEVRVPDEFNNQCQSF